MPVTLDDK
ncbi:hypothetical protein YPPY99_3055, partial [Yersinia pestis PY-99]